MTSFKQPKTYWRKLKDFIDRRTTPLDLTIDDGIRYWQERLLLILVLVCTFLGFFVYLPSVTLSIKENMWIVAVADTIIYGWMVILFFCRSIPFMVRAVTISLFSYFLGMVLLLTIGPFGGGPVWLFAFPVIVALIQRFRISLIALALNVVTVIVLGILLEFGHLEWNYPSTYPVELWTEIWIVVALNFLLLNSIVTISVVFISGGMQNLLKRQKSTLVSLEEEITERKLVEQTLRESEERLRQVQKMESIGTLAGGIAHDFNNILFPIVGYTEMLLEDIPADSPQRGNLNEIYTSTLRAKDLVKQILTFSRQDNIEIKLVRIQPVIKEALKLIRSTIPTSIEIKQYVRKDCGIIKADPTQIHQVVMNLATNAYHAMENTGGELEVSLKESELGEQDLPNPDMEPGTYACLTVADTGVGMDKDVKEKIFDPYFTTKENGKGTGMGLSVVHGIVKSAGGSIHVYSEPDKGTEFHVYLPVVKSSSAQQEIQTKESIPGGTERILLVDDEEAIVTMEKQLLERLGYQVVSRTSSVEALEAFRADSDKFDLVITDMAMPNMSGDKLASELIRVRSDIPILLCTGFSEQIPEEKAAALGIKGLLMKPIIKRGLSKMIREVLDKKQDK